MIQSNMHDYDSPAQHRETEYLNDPVLTGRMKMKGGAVLIGIFTALWIVIPPFHANIAHRITG